MTDDPVTHVFTVRGRPVGFAPGRFGGALVVVERGFFPISATGYRSLAGHAGNTEPLTPDAVSADFLEGLAQAQDRTRGELLARLRRVPVPTADRLGNFIGVSITAEAALAEGFFAPDDARFTLWRGAFRFLDLIDTDTRFQPTPTAPAWTASGCAQALALRRALLAFVRELAKGELPTPPDGTHLAGRAYFDLPPKAHREPAFTLPELTAELPLDLPPPADVSEDEEPEDVDEAPAEIDEDDPAQISLL